MSKNLNIGQILTEPQEKDAIHVAVCSAIAGQNCKPGDNVELVTNLDDLEYHAVFGKNPIGIIDPFLKQKIKQGERCYIFLYPQTITSLKHNWTHPVTEKLDRKIQENMDVLTEKCLGRSSEYLKGVADQLNMSYEELMDTLGASINDADFYHTLSMDTPDFLYQEREKIWENYEKATGTKVLDKERVPFSCSC